MLQHTPAILWIWLKRGFKEKPFRTGLSIDLRIWPGLILFSMLTSNQAELAQSQPAWFPSLSWCWSVVHRACCIILGLQRPPKACSTQGIGKQAARLESWLFVETPRDQNPSFHLVSQRHCVSHVESKKAILPGCLRQIWVGTPEIGARTTSRLMALYIRYDLAYFFPQIVQIWAGQTDLSSVQDAISLIQPKAVVLMSFGDWSWLRVQHQCWFQLFGKAVAPGRSAFRFNWHFYMFLHLHFGTCRVCVHVCTLFIEWLETIWYDHDLCNLFNGQSTAPATFGNADFISDWWAAVVPLKRSCKAALRCWGTLEVPKTALLKWILTRTLITYPHLNLSRILKLQFDHMVMNKHAPLSTLKPAKIRWITEFGWVWAKILLFPDFFLKGHSHSRIPAAWLVVVMTTPAPIPTPMANAPNVAQDRVLKSRSWGDIYL